jgi:outer membrane protein OmpA-like peptidoglycan-associated protein
VVRDVRIGAGVGGGLGHGYGTPVLRGLLSLEWATGRAREERKNEEPPEPRTPWEGFGEGGGDVTPKKPLATVTETEIHIEEEIRFATDSADLVGESDKVLAAVKRILDEHPELRRIRVEGHTDAVGDPTYNDELSTRRAATVEAWLVSHGVAADRLESAGIGSKQPIDTNETEAGRAKNRRVVFKIIDR